MVRSELMDGGLIRHWSDEGRELLQVETGRSYDTAVDTVPCRYTYREVGEPQLPDTEVLAQEAYLLAQANHILLKEVLT